MLKEGVYLSMSFQFLYVKVVKTYKSHEKKRFIYKAIEKNSRDLF